MLSGTITSWEFDQNVAQAKRSAQAGPVVVTDRGRPAPVLLTYEAYEALRGRGRSMGEALASPETAEIDLDLDRAGDQALREMSL